MEQLPEGQDYPAGGLWEEMRGWEGRTMEGYILTELVDKVMQSCYSLQPATPASGPPAEAQQREAEQIPADTPVPSHRLLSE